VRRFEEQWPRPEDLKQTLKRITSLLEKRYGFPERGKHANPLDTLIQTILSQNTNDLNRDRAYTQLRRDFPRWEDLLRAKRGTIAAAIRPAGLAHQKSRTILEVLRWIQKREGRLSLSFLKKMGSEEIQKVFREIKGVGPKTVHCLLLFGLQREAFPVDTHILRIGKRVGFIPEGMDADQAHRWVKSLIPEGKSFSLHLNLIRFGRSVCKARNPGCLDCLLAEECLYPPK